jgi:hypothetical protein
VAAVLMAALLVPAVALAQFPGADPRESPRANTPNDPEFDRCEADDPDTAEGDCSSYFEEQFGTFGFSPDSANYLPPASPALHATTGTRYTDCEQLDAQGREANVKAENAGGNPTLAEAAECLQIAGVRADTAWKFSDGSPQVVIAVLDTGILWQQPELTEKVALNAAELPPPQNAAGEPCPAGSCNGDPTLTVSDYADDPRVDEAAGDEEADGMLDGSDLIAEFSDEVDDDANGYVDDIAGWDFFDDDNDPFDASSCCSASGHGTGRAMEAAAQTDNAQNGLGLCPDCRIMPLRVWDTFVVPTDNFAMGVAYAADNGASVVEGAVGGLTNTQFARSVFTYADSKGLALMLVSSDINSANHNYPTNYNEAVYVAGSLPDTAPNDTCTGAGGLPGLGDVPFGPGDIPGFDQGCSELLDQLAASSGCDEVPPASSCVAPGTAGQPTTTSFFRNANLTQYGGKADIVLMGATGSQNTGQASGAAGLLASFGRETFGAGDPLSGNEIRQLLTMTAEDVRPLNTGTIGLPDRANEGWDSHFGYGRVNLAGAMARITNERGAAAPEDWPCADEAPSCVPPEAQIDSPDWFAPINVDRVPDEGIEIRGRALAPHAPAGSGVGDWEVEYACGQDATDDDFAPIPGGGISGSGPVAGGTFGNLPRSLLVELATSCDGSVANDAGRPAGTADQEWPADPFPEPDPERHAFQIRLTVQEAANPDNIGRYRKTLHAYADDGNRPGWPRPVGSGSDPSLLRTGSGGEASPRLFDLDGDNRLDVVQATSSGELSVRGSDGEPLESFNGGEPVTTQPIALAGSARLDPSLEAPRESLRVPALGDVDGDLESDIIATAGEHVYAWDRHGDPLGGFPLRLDPALSEPCDSGVEKPCFNRDDRAITPQNHIKRGFFGSPALADLDEDGALDIVAGAMDQHVYAWSGDGELLPGFPAKLETEGANGAEIVTTPAIAQLDGTGPPEIVISTNEVAPGDPELPTSLFEIPNALISSSAGFNPVYALHGDGEAVEGWPVEVGVAAGDLLPLVLPGHDSAVLDSDGDPADDEVSVSAATSLAATGGSRLVDGDGQTLSTYENAAGNTIDQGPILNLADYTSVGDLSGGDTPLVLKGGLTLNGAANLLAPNQNLPFSHVEQAWDPATGQAVPGYPRATDDFQLLSQGSVAQVAGGGPERQVLVGTGLYQLHAYGPDGAEAEGWPKFAGGWIQSTPAVGDADRDGDLDVSAVTREGWSFLWDTGQPACGGSNGEWWTFHHDEHSTANYGHDGRPPGSPEDLTAERDPGTNTVSLRWTAPGDDWLCGTAARYRVIAADGPIDEPQDGTVLTEQDAGDGAGATLERSFEEGTVGDATHVAVLYRDEEGNWGILRSVEIPPVARCGSRIVGTSGRDVLAGTAGSDLIRGRRGPDALSGRGGGDCVKGGRGADRLGGGPGDDEIAAGKGRDLARGGSGDDEIRATGAGVDKVRCGTGDDHARVGRRDSVAGSCERVSRR